MVQLIAHQQMQQIASSKTGTAASSLPFNLSRSALGAFSGQNESRNDFNTTMLRQAESVKVYEQPRERPAPITDNRIDNTRSQDLARQQRERQELHASAKQNELNDARKRIQASRERDIPSQQDRNPAQRSNKEANYAQQDASYVQKRNDSLDAQRARNVKDVNDTPLHQPVIGNAPEKNIGSVDDTVQQNTRVSPKEGLTNTDDASADAFDYIEYVTALAKFNTPEASTQGGQGDVLDTTNASDLFHTNISPSPTDTLVDEDLSATNLAALILPDGLGGNNQASAQLGDKILLSLAAGVDTNQLNAPDVSITTEDLQALIDAKQETPDAKAAQASPGQQTDVQEIIAELVKQTSSVNSPNDAHNNPNVNAADQALVEALLLTQVKNADGEITLPPNPDEAAPSITDIKDKLGAQLPNPDKKDTVTNVHWAHGSSKQTTDTDTPLLAGLAVSDEAAKNTASNSTILPAQTSALAQSGAPVSLPEAIGVNKKSDTNASSLIALGELTEQQAKAALENLSQRVQSATSQISGQSAGNEFIAALQSGVKEFKQQLAQGREPGIDLKALVTEALAQISGEATKAQQPKVDAAISQFSSALQLAAAVNNAAGALHTQAAATTDSQLAKEISIGQVEGTKLANTQTSQLNAQASADKAINIFKQEGQQQLAEKVRWMVNARTATAEIRLDPADLGGINIKINVSGDTAQVNFNVQSAAAKEALDQAAPRLREMLQDQGIELGQSSVQQDARDNQHSQSNEQDHSATLNQTAAGANPHDSKSPESDLGSQHVAEQRITNGAIGGIDYYA